MPNTNKLGAFADESSRISVNTITFMPRGYCGEFFLKEKRQYYK